MKCPPPSLRNTEKGHDVFRPVTAPQVSSESFASAFSTWLGGAFDRLRSVFIAAAPFFNVPTWMLQKRSTPHAAQGAVAGKPIKGSAALCPQDIWEQPHPKTVKKHMSLLRAASNASYPRCDKATIIESTLRAPAGIYKLNLVHDAF